jgi:hypothetical protein
MALNSATVDNVSTAACDWSLWQGHDSRMAVGGQPCTVAEQPRSLRDFHTIRETEWDLVIGSDLIYNDIGVEWLPRVSRSALLARLSPPCLASPPLAKLARQSWHAMTPAACRCLWAASSVLRGSAVRVLHANVQAHLTGGGMAGGGRCCMIWWGMAPPPCTATPKTDCPCATSTSWLALPRLVSCAPRWGGGAVAKDAAARLAACLLRLC